VLTTAFSKRKNVFLLFHYEGKTVLEVSYEFEYDYFPITVYNCSICLHDGWGMKKGASAPFFMRFLFQEELRRPS